MNIPKDLDIETVTVTDLVGALSPLAPDVAAQVSNFESIDDVVMFDVWTAEETAQIEAALRAILTMRERANLGQTPTRLRAQRDYHAFVGVVIASDYYSIGGPASVRRR